MKITLIPVLIIVSACLTVISAAYFIDKELVVNEFKTSHSDITIEEEVDPPGEENKIPPGTDLKKKVWVSNNDIESYVRCYLEFSDSRYEKKTIIDYNTKDWEKVGDYWYFRKLLNKGEKTTPLMTKIHVTEEIPYNFEVIVRAESVHAEGAINYKEAFERIN